MDLWPLIGAALAEGIGVAGRINIIDMHLSDAEMKLFVRMLEHYRENQAIYIGDLFSFFAPAFILSLSERFLQAFEVDARVANACVAPTDEYWIFIRKDGDGYSIKASSLYGVLSETIVMANGFHPFDEDYNRALTGVRSNWKSREISLKHLAEFQS